jgi:hypothetical protein
MSIKLFLHCCHPDSNQCLLLPVNLENSPLILKCPRQDDKHKGGYQKKQPNLKALPRPQMKIAQMMHKPHRLLYPDQSLNPLLPKGSSQLGPNLRILRLTNHRRR